MERGQNRFWAFIEQWEAFGPACGDIGEAEGIQGAALTVSTIVGDEVGFQKTRVRVVPAVEGPNGDVVFEERSSLGSGKPTRT